MIFVFLRVYRICICFTHLVTDSLTLVISIIDIDSFFLCSGVPISCIKMSQHKMPSAQPSSSSVHNATKNYIRGKEPAPSLLNHYRGHRGTINSVAFHPHLETVYSAGADKYIMSWNFKKETRALRYNDYKI